MSKVSTTLPEVRGCDRSGIEEEMSPTAKDIFKKIPK
jgi:hypothetical protein